MVKLLSIVSVFVLSFCAVNATLRHDRHGVRHRLGQGDAVVRHVKPERDLGPIHVALQAKKKRASGINARRCGAKHTTTSTTSSVSESTTTSSKVKLLDTKPTTTTTPYDPPATPTPTPTHTHKHDPSPTSSEEPATTSKGGDTGGQTFSGDGTFYNTGLNACGTVDHDTDMIAAASYQLWADFGSLDNTNHSPICGRYVIASYGGQSVRVKITDKCMGCDKYSLDFSPTAFKLIADPNLGRIKITWRWA